MSYNPDPGAMISAAARRLLSTAAATIQGISDSLYQAPHSPPSPPGGTGTPPGPPGGQGGPSGSVWYLAPVGGGCVSGYHLEIANVSAYYGPPLSIPVCVMDGYTFQSGGSGAGGTIPPGTV